MSQRLLETWDPYRLVNTCFLQDLLEVVKAVASTKNIVRVPGDGGPMPDLQLWENLAIATPSIMLYKVVTVKESPTTLSPDKVSLLKILANSWRKFKDGLAPSYKACYINERGLHPLSRVIAYSNGQSRR